MVWSNTASSSASLPGSGPAMDFRLIPQLAAVGGHFALRASQAFNAAPVPARRQTPVRLPSPEYVDQCPAGGGQLVRQFVDHIFVPVWLPGAVEVWVSRVMVSPRRTAGSAFCETGVRSCRHPAGPLAAFEDWAVCACDWFGIRSVSHSVVRAVVKHAILLA